MTNARIHLVSVKYPPAVSLDLVEIATNIITIMIHIVSRKRVKCNRQQTALIMVICSTYKIKNNKSNSMATNDKECLTLQKRYTLLHYIM